MSGNTSTWLLAAGLVIGAGVAALWTGGRQEPTTPAPEAVAPASASGMPAPPPPQGRIGGKVAEVLQVESYTYLRFEDGTWAAVSKADVAVGDQAALASATLMRDFESKALGRTFEAIYFGSLANAPSAAEPSLPPGHPPMTGTPTPSPSAAAADVDVVPAEGGVTVAELYGKAAELEGKTVTFAGQVMKVTPRVLGKTWLHVQDGTGDASAGTHDVVVTTQAEPNVGDKVTLTGTLTRNKDLGSGYRYEVLVEDATLNPAL